METTERLTRQVDGLVHLAASLVSDFQSQQPLDQIRTKIAQIVQAYSACERLLMELPGEDMSHADLMNEKAKLEKQIRMKEELLDEISKMPLWQELEAAGSLHKASVQRIESHALQLPPSATSAQPK
eukprot:TRINITY_DN2685_c0_g1_i1.p1 TRINITY_DN2685_c0_g1~~TRINITY_DN2685_c0_g1_i1.p1  ORF type:complete len:127 (+),score=30.49 TRINITY_DN2685_c0_g1_i1:114-494(+)